MIGQTRIILNIRIVLNTRMKIICSQLLPEVQLQLVFGSEYRVLYLIPKKQTLLD